MSAAKKKRRARTGKGETFAQFLRNASHTLRTPLTVSRLDAEMLLSDHAGKLSSKQRKYISDIYVYNKKLLTLLDSFFLKLKKRRDK